jgi:UDP:flavonoid glycosyltransferase YjiC (YdhE family)
MEFPHAGVPLPDHPPYWPILVEVRNEARAELGLPPVPLDGWRARYWSQRLVLIASSRHFGCPLLQDDPQAVLTGFWFDDDTGGPEPIDGALRRFLDSGPPPLVLTFSSQPLRDPATVLNAHVEAARRLGLRLVIQRGWAGFDPAMLIRRGDDGSLHFAGHVPHDVLFRRALAVIHHGGIGSTAQALRQGRPALVEPHCNDQFFNAMRIHELGVGTKLLPDQVTADSVEEVLAKVVLTPTTRNRAEELQRGVIGEDGLAAAHDWIAGNLGL